jgi:hypothetical protein
MRKTMLPGTAIAAALLAATLFAATPATAATPAPAPAEPTCLITTNVAKATLCAQLIQSGDQLTAKGTYQTASTTPVTLTVTVTSGGLNQPTATLATNTMSGTGNLTATSAPATPPAGATLLRACAKLTTSTHQGYLQVCTAT